MGSPGSASLPHVITLPEYFSQYNHNLVDFERALSLFAWKPTAKDVAIDLSGCKVANYQALTLLVQYMWQLEAMGYRVSVKYDDQTESASAMMSKMGADGWREVLVGRRKDFIARPGRSKYRKGLFALRDRRDVQSAIDGTRETIRQYVSTFPDYLSYIIAELLYNATEHGCLNITLGGSSVRLPALMNFGYYSRYSRFSFIFSDLGIGIKAHLERAYPPHETHQEAILHALQPNVSGTFANRNPYSVQNNAGLGLTYSSSMLRRLKGDMYIVSHDGLVHVSPADVTSRRLAYNWPGTFVYVSLELNQTPQISLEELLSEVRNKAIAELEYAERQDEDERLSVSMHNIFGKYLEDKDAGIRYRDRVILPALESGKRLEIDFRGVETAPHSFLNAFFATPVKRLKNQAMKRIRLFNCPSHIREIIDIIFVDNS